MARRERGDVYMYDYGGAAGIRPMVIVSPDTGSKTALGVEVTNTAFNAPHVVPVISMEASNLTGFVRCDRIVTVEHDDAYFKAFRCSLSAADMALIDRGLKAALGL